jgi:hypothetical protein
MGKSKPMTPKAAARIQSTTAKTSGTGQVSKGSFATRAQRSASKNNSNT